MEFEEFEGDARLGGLTHDLYLRLKKMIDETLDQIPVGRVADACLLKVLAGLVCGFKGQELNAVGVIEKYVVEHLEDKKKANR